MMATRTVLIVSTMASTEAQSQFQGNRSSSKRCAQRESTQHELGDATSVRSELLNIIAPNFVPK